MHIFSIGLNFNSAPVDLRERLVFGEDQIGSALNSLKNSDAHGSLVELVVLSTCNRIEIYAASREADPRLEHFLSEARGVPREEFIQILQRYDDIQAARHLFHVAAGLDSQVLGESQILGQVTRALELARRQNTIGPMLNHLFQSAIHAGKRARTETGISRNPASVSSLAASLAERAFHPLAEAQVVILGAGEMAELAVEAMRKRGVHRILVVNRTLERAAALAKRWQAEAWTFDRLSSALSAADVLVSSTGAPRILISAEMIHQAMRTRPGRPLALIDIAVPRDIDPAAADIPRVKLYDIDHLNARLEDSLAERMSEVPQVKAILEQELAAFSEYLVSMEMLSLIAEVHRKTEIVRQAELEKTLRRLPSLTEAEQDRIQSLTQALTGKILAAPIQFLRAQAASPRAPEYAALARALFQLTEDGSHPASTPSD